MSDKRKTLLKIQTILLETFPPKEWNLQTEINFHKQHIRVNMQLFDWPGSDGEYWSPVMFGDSLEECIVQIKAWLASVTKATKKVHNDGAY